MSGPAWLADAFAAIMIATAAYCLSRLVAARRLGRPTERDVDATHVLMGVAMAGMLVPELNSLPRVGWVVIFSLSAAWFGGQMLIAWRGADPGQPDPRHHLPHLLASAAMLYMLLTVSRGTGASAGLVGGAAGSAHSPTLALLFALALLGYVIWTTDRLPALARTATVRPAAPRSARRPAPAASSVSLAGPAQPASLVRAADPVLSIGLGSPAGPVLSASSGSASPGASAGPAPAADAADLASHAAASVGRAASVDRPLSPFLAACCEIAMGVTMGYVLILML